MQREDTGVDAFNPMPPNQSWDILPVDQGKVRKYNAMSGTPISLAELCSMGEEMTTTTPIFFARLLQQELPIRFASRIVDIAALPFESESKNWRQVRSCYEQSFTRLLEQMPSEGNFHVGLKTHEEERRFR